MAKQYDLLRPIDFIGEQATCKRSRKPWQDTFATNKSNVELPGRVTMRY